MPRGQRALAVSTQTPLVRSLDAPRPIDPRPFRAPLRIMALMSNPSGTAALNLDEERVRIEQSWARLPGVEVDFVRPVRGRDPQAAGRGRLPRDPLHGARGLRCGRGRDAVAANSRTAAPTG